MDDSIVLGSTVDITLSHLETLQNSLISERHERASLVGKVGELEGMVSMLSQQFRHASIERDVEKAKTHLFADAHGDIRSPSLVARTVAALLDYPNIHICCLIKVNTQWVIINELNDEHIYITSSQFEDVVDSVELNEVMLDRVAALPSAVVNALSIAYSKRFDAYTVKDNLIFSAISRDCAWVIVSDGSLKPLVDSLAGWTALLVTASRLAVDAYRRQQEDVERAESEMIRNVFDTIFQILFTSSERASRTVLARQLQQLTEVLNSALVACSSELFVLDSNNISINSSLEHINLSSHTESSVLLTAVLQQRTAVCVDPHNPHRDPFLDCGGVTSPIAAIIATPLWISSESSGYCLLRLFEGYAQDRYVKLVESLAATIGPMIHFWTTQRLIVLLKDLNHEVDDDTREAVVPSFDHASFRLLASEGASALQQATFLRAVSSFMQCTWTIVITASRTVNGAFAFSIVNDSGEMRAFSLNEAKEELKGFLYSIFGIEDDSLVAYENSLLSHRKGLIHLLNGLDSKASGLQALVRYTLKSITNLIGFRVVHPDAENSAAPSVAVIAGRGWGTVDSAEVCPRAQHLSAVFEFAAEHRSIVRLLGVSDGLRNHISSLEDGIQADRENYAALIDFSTKIATATDAVPLHFRKTLFDALGELGGRLQLSLQLCVYETVHSSFWRLGAKGNWERDAASTVSAQDLEGKQARGVYAVREQSLAMVSVETAWGMTMIFYITVRCANLTENIEHILVSVTSVLTTEAAAGSSMFGFENAPFRRAAPEPLDLLHFVKQELQGDCTETFRCAALLRPLLAAFTPYALAVPIFVSGDAVISLLDSMELPNPLSRAVRSITSTTSPAPRFELLGNADIYLSHLKQSHASLPVLEADRAYLYCNPALQGLVSANDAVVVIVLCASSCLLPPSAFQAFDQAFVQDIGPVRLLNQVARSVVHRGAYHDMATENARTNDFLHSIRSVVEPSAPETSTHDLEELQTLITFNTTLLKTTMDLLVTRNLVDIATSALESVANSLLESSSTSVAISWTSPDVCSTKGIYSAEMMKLVVSSGKPLLIEDLPDDSPKKNHKNTREATISYVPVMSRIDQGRGRYIETTHAVLEYRTPSTMSAHPNEDLLHRYIESAVQSLGQLMVMQKKTPSDKDSRCSLAQLLTMLSSVSLNAHFINEVSGLTSYLLCDMLRCDVCLMDKSNMTDAFYSRISSPEGPTADLNYLAGTVYRWRDDAPVADSGTTYFQEQFLPAESLLPMVSSPILQGKESKTLEVYTLVRRISGQLIVIESEQRISSTVAAHFDTFISLLDVMNRLHAMRTLVASQTYRLRLESLCRNIQNSKTEPQLMTFVNEHLKAALTCKDAVMLKIPRNLIVDIDEARRRKEYSLFGDTSDAVRSSDEHLAALCLSTDAILPCKKGTLETEAPSVFIPVIVMEREPSYAFKLSFANVSGLNDFLESSKEQSRRFVAVSVVDDVVTVADTVAQWIHRAFYIKKNEDFSIYSSAALDLSSVFSRLFNKAVESSAPAYEMMDATGSTSARPGSPLKSQRPSPRAFSSESIYENLAYELMEFNEGLGPSDIVSEFRLLWVQEPPPHNPRAETGWVTHATIQRLSSGSFTPMQTQQTLQGDISIVLKASGEDEALLRSLARRQIVVDPLASGGCRVLLSLSPHVVLQLSLSRLIFPLAYMRDSLELSHRGARDGDTLEVAWNSLLSIQQSARFMFTAAGAAHDTEEVFRKTQRTIEAEASLLAILAECIADIYGQSAVEVQGNRIEGSLQAALCNLKRLPGVADVDIEYKTPAGEVFNADTGRFSTTPALSKSLLGSRTRFEQPRVSEFPFECHDVKGRVLLYFAEDDGYGDQVNVALTETVVSSVATVLSRRLYELDKALRNRSAMKAKVEEISKRNKEIAEVDDQRAAVQSSLEEQRAEVRRLTTSLQMMQTAYEDEKKAHAETVEKINHVVNESQAALTTSQSNFEAELLKIKEKVQKYKVECRALIGEKTTNEAMISKLQETLTAQEQDYVKRENEWKLLNADAHKTSQLINEMRQTAQFQSIHVSQLEEEKRQLVAEREKLSNRIAVAEQHSAYIDSNLALVQKEVTDLKAEKERAIAKIQKRDSKLQDAAVMIENLQRSLGSSKEDTALLIMQLQVENKDLLSKLQSAREGSERAHRQDDDSAVKVSLGVLQSSLVHSESELTSLREKYDTAVNVTIPQLRKERDEARLEVAQLKEASAVLQTTVNQKTGEIEIWKKKFAVQEKERDTLIAGWKDIVSTAGGGSISSGNSGSRGAAAKKSGPKAAWK